MTVWLLEREVFADRHERLAAAAEAAGDRVVWWHDEWWSDGRWPDPGAGPVVFHGALENADRVRRELPWSPGAFCATARFECSAWWPEAADLLVAERHVVTTVADLVAGAAPEGSVRGCSCDRTARSSRSADGCSTVSASRRPPSTTASTTTTTGSPSW